MKCRGLKSPGLQQLVCTCHLSLIQHLQDWQHKLSESFLNVLMAKCDTPQRSSHVSSTLLIHLCGTNTQAKLSIKTIMYNRYCCHNDRSSHTRPLISILRPSPASPPQQPSGHRYSPIRCHRTKVPAAKAALWLPVANPALCCSW